MNKAVVWWVAVLGAIILTGIVRQEARARNYNVGAVDTLIPQIKSVLLSNGLSVNNLILDSDYSDVVVGISTQMPYCQGSLNIMEFSIELVARNVVPDYVPTGYNHLIYYYNSEYTGSRRAKLTLLWAKYLFLGKIGWGETRHTRKQLLVSWPDDCAEPALNWSAVWLNNGKGLK